MGIKASEKLEENSTTEEVIKAEECKKFKSQISRT
jgi:hypothetical protein